MILTAENYYSQEANREYISVSQYKTFCGTMGKLPCEALAMAELNNEWAQVKSTSMMVGSYVDAHFEGTLDLFKAKNPEIFTKQGGLRSEYKKAEEIINRIERDELFMQFMSGEKQVIMTGEIGGTKWKIKLDSFHRGLCIVDLKIMKSIRETFWVPDAERMCFVPYWGYDIQGAVYQEIVRQNTGELLPFYIAAATKESESDIEIIQISNEHMREKLIEVEGNVPKIIALKSGEYEPIRCERCDYCKNTKILTKPIDFTELLTEI